MAINGTFFEFTKNTRGRDSKAITFEAFGKADKTEEKDEAGNVVKVDLSLIEDGQITDLQEAIKLFSEKNMSVQDMCDGLVRHFNRISYQRVVGVDELDELLSSVFDMNDEAEKAQASSLKRAANAAAKGMIAGGIETTPLNELQSLLNRLTAKAG